MAVTTHGVTTDSVLAKIAGNIDSSRISATSVPLSTGDVEEYIDEAAGEINAILTRAGLSPDSLDDDTTEQVQRAIRLGAAAQVLSTLGYTGGTYSDLRAQYEDLKRLYSNRREALNQRAGRVRSNIAASSTKRDSKFGGLDYEF
jgi:hypothetical protein